MDLILPTAGTLVVLLCLLDVFYTVLFPASGRGPIRKPVSSAAWNAFAFVGKRLTGDRRRSFLAYAGPVIIVVTLAVWVLLLVSGWAMIYKPALGGAIRAAVGPTDTGWATALYFSALNLTTLGVGDVAAHTGLYRLLTVAEAAIGFGFYSMVIAYFVSVYPSLTTRNAFARGLHHMTGGTGDAAELLARLVAGADLSHLGAHLSTKADFLRQTHETHRFYPVLRYFQYREPYYGLPRVLLVSLDSGSLIRSARDNTHHPGVIRDSALEELSEAAMALLRELVPECEPSAPSDAEIRAWRQRYADALERFAPSGLKIRTDLEAGADEYVRLRSVWDRPVHALAARMLDEWHVVDREPAPAKPDKASRRS